ncbi:hypothetical protein CIPAW_14G001200 [Carya illinoinensis]|uniref:Cation/H+ exchanger transmembrane domain-containing protein n=1 Tax=Carya illinoinensis TaxID=32201 RepID=A0A8T1NF11_CARIL|nr:hypothetical protein CIPAW_14G001200 [Carya illinoinensis]
MAEKSLEDDPCSGKLTAIFTRAAKHVFGFFLMVVLCNVTHFLLKPFSQPRITSDTFIGMIIGNLGIVHSLIDKSAAQTLRFIIDFGMICYMLVLGIEMDPYVLFKVPTRDAKVAYAGMLSTFILACFLTPYLNYTHEFKIHFTLTLSTALSSTASPVLTRIITSCKIGKSDIGRLVIAAGIHSDFISTLLISIGYIVCPIREKPSGKSRLQEGIEMSSALVLQTVITAKVSPIIMNWVNNENPEGKPMKGSHLVLSVAFMALVCSCSPAYGYSPILSAFMAGIFLPREGRVSKWVISKVNYLLTTIFYPIFFIWMGFEADFREFQPGEIGTWTHLVLLFVITTAGKVTGTVISGVVLGFHWPESVALGLLLSTKGHYQIYLAIAARTVRIYFSIFFTMFCSKETSYILFFL